MTITIPIGKKSLDFSFFRGLFSSQSTNVNLRASHQWKPTPINEKRKIKMSITFAFDSMNVRQSPSIFSPDFKEYLPTPVLLHKIFPGWLEYSKVADYLNCKSEDRHKDF